MEHFLWLQLQKVVTPLHYITDARNIPFSDKTRIVAKLENIAPNTAEDSFLKIRFVVICFSIRLQQNELLSTLLFATLLDKAHPHSNHFFQSIKSLFTDCPFSRNFFHGI